MIIRIVALGLVLGAGAAAADGPASRTDARAAFDQLKSLAGRWEGGDSRQERLTYELIAGGTALVEREVAAGRPEMLTVYHLDGDRLVLTHYCMAGNQPRMQLTAFDRGAGTLKFDFVDAANLTNAGSGHMHSARLRIVDVDHLATEWQFYENGSARMTESTEFTRVR